MISCIAHNKRTMNNITPTDLKALIDDSVETIVSKHVQQLAHGVAKRFDGVNDRFDSVNERFDSIDRRINSIDKRIDGIDQRFDENVIVQNEILTAISNVHDSHEQRIVALEKKVL